MRFIVGEGGLLFSYGSLRNGEILDYRFFWMGRSSGKKDYLVRYGIFNPLFRIFEDVDLPFRLSKHGLKVVYNKKAVTYMMRPIDFEDFCRRCIQQGKAYYLCSLLHPEPEIQKFCLMEDINNSILQVKKDFSLFIHQAKELNRLANQQINSGIPLDQPFKRLLHEAYGKAFWACRIKGMMEERSQNRPPVNRNNKITFLLDPIRRKDDFSVVAIICVYNEEDIISQTLEHLIQNGVWVYLLDHHSTDQTIREASKWLGQGLLHMETFPEESGFSEDYREVFSLPSHYPTGRTAPPGIGRRLGYALRRRSISGIPLAGADPAGTRLVDTLGFNAVNFEYLNFWSTDDDSLPGQDVRDFIRYYEPATELDKPRINAWKNFGQAID